MCETCLRFIPEGFCEWSTEVILAEFGAVIEVIWKNVSWEFL